MAAAGPIRRSLFLAHRGDWTHAPENSLASFVAARERPGVDGVELDVRLSADGVPVVIHDDDLSRVQGVARKVSDLSSLELGRLGVPDLASVLGVLPSPSFIDVELKEDAAEQAVPVIALARGDPPGDLVVSSFLPAALRSLHRVAPGWPCWLIHEQLDQVVVGAARDLGCVGIAAEWPSLDERSVAMVQEAKLGLATWTVEDLATLPGVLAFAPVAVCLDPSALPDQAGGPTAAG